MPTEIRHPDLVRFTCGDCHIYARVLSKHTGWPMYCFTTDMMMPTDHAFVLHPSGDPVDIEGRHNLSTFLERWDHEPHEMAEFTWEQLKAIEGWDHTQFGEYSYRRARKLINITLKMVEDGQYFRYDWDLETGDEWSGV